MSPQPSISPAGVPPSGNAKYAVIALLMLIGIVALFARRCSVNRANSAPAPSVTVVQPAEPPSNPKLDDIPPPPPTEDTAEEKPIKSGRGAYNPAAGCEGKCKGTYPPELEQALQVRAAKARRCYNQALTQDSSLKGHVTIDVRIGPAGNVCSAQVISNDMGTPGVADCAAKMFRGSEGYPSPRGGCVDAKVPLSFVASGQ